jgi:glycosyltransferase involved in cell wall biosynthesis
MLAAWCAAAWSRRGAPDVLVVGTDPILSVLVGLVVKKRWPQVRVVHWCFDLYPEGAVADGLLRERGWVVRGVRRLLRAAYASCDLVADLGGCMRDRLEWYGHGTRKVTLVPWALDEPAEPERPDPVTRRELFGEAPLGLLYSGNFGRAHSFAEFLDLGRRLRGSGVHLCFGVRGNRAEELRRAVGPGDENVRFAGFAPEAALGKRLAAADIHLVSLRPEWTGLVVPSKFFGSLAAGRPVLFAGSRDAAIARWIVEHHVGWILDAGSLGDIAGRLQELAASPSKLADLQRHCHRVYQQEFCRRRVMRDWDRELRGLLAAPQAQKSRQAVPAEPAPVAPPHPGWVLEEGAA